jgi:hypothetical protein
MKAHWRYLIYVLRHKWFVLVAGLRLRVSLIQLITHDWSKFLPSEWGPYVAYFYGDLPEHDPEDPCKWMRRGYYGPTKADAQAAFDVAWNYHQKRQPHHWQYWLLTTDQPRATWVITSTDGGMRYAGVANYELFPDRNFAEMSASGEQAHQDAEWLRTILNRAPVPLQMPERYVREMVADWMGAGRAITGRWEVAQWYARSRPHIILHPATRARVEELIEGLP